MDTIYSSIRNLLGKQGVTIAGTVFITIVIVSDRAHFDAKLDAIRSQQWTISMEEIRDSWIMIHNPSNSIPVTWDIVRESKRVTPDLRNIGRIIPP